MLGSALRRASLVGVAVALAGFTAVGCSSGGGASAGKAKTISTGAAPSTSETDNAAAGSATASSSSDDKAVQARITNVITAEKTIYVDESAYTDDIGKLSQLDDTFRLTKGLTAPTSPSQVAVATASDHQWACATGRSASGHTVVMVAGPGSAVFLGTTAVGICARSATATMRQVAR